MSGAKLRPEPVKLSRDVNPLLLMVVVAIVIVATSTIIDPNSNDLLFALTMAGVAFVVLWTLPQAYKPRKPRS